MAKPFLGILGPYIGKVGTVVGRKWKGSIYTIAAYVKNIRDARTRTQLEQRMRFGTIGAMTPSFIEAINLGFKQKADQKQMTPSNIFVKNNISAVTVTYPDTITVDYSNIRVSAGRLPEVGFGTPSFDDPLTVEVALTGNSDTPGASATDKVYLLVYCPEDSTGLLSEPVARTAASIIVTVPRHWNGVKVHVWGFAINENGICSRSRYLGFGNIG